MGVLPARTSMARTWSGWKPGSTTRASSLPSGAISQQFVSNGLSEWTSRYIDATSYRPPLPGPALPLFHVARDEDPAVRSGSDGRLARPAESVSALGFEAIRAGREGTRGRLAVLDVFHRDDRPVARDDPDRAAVESVRGAGGRAASIDDAAGNASGREDPVT